MWWQLFDLQPWLVMGTSYYNSILPCVIVYGAVNLSEILDMISVRQSRVLSCFDCRGVADELFFLHKNYLLKGVRLPQSNSSDRVSFGFDASIIGITVNDH